MAIGAANQGERGSEQKKPLLVWMAEDGLSIICPFCGTEKQSDDYLGRHLVHDHWREIEFATKHVRDLNARNSE